uniref:Uncharacterized protein n=1 Tax=Triticum urartu TaxID=4572 RepID=A0A8R7QFD0_TRIUA
MPLEAAEPTTSVGRGRTSLALPCCPSGPHHPRASPAPASPRRLGTFSSRPGSEPRMRRPHATISPFEHLRLTPDCCRQLHWKQHDDPDAFKHKLGGPQQGDRARAAAGQ